MEYLTSLSLAEIIQRIIIMELWFAIIAVGIFFICMFVATCRELDERDRYPKEWKKKDEEWNLQKRK